jgi:hypothetical protein
MHRALLWILACASCLLLLYEGTTLIGSVWRPLLANPQSIQTDYHYYDGAARRFAAGGALYIATDDVIAGFAYPPPAIVPFLVLSRLPLGVGLLVMSLASYAVVLIAIRAWLSYLRRHDYRIDAPSEWAILLIALGLGPTYMNAVFGQVNAFVLGAAVGYATLAAPTAGAVLALGILLKIYPALLAASAVWDTRARRAVMWAALAAAVIVIVLLPVVPWANYGAYLDVLRTRGDKTAIHIINQSLTAFLERFGYPAAQFLNWTGQDAVTVALPIRVLNAVAALAGVLVCWVRARQGRTPESVAGLMALIAVVAPLGWGHAYVMVLPLLALQLASLERLSTAMAAVVCISVCAFMVPAGRHMGLLDALPAALQNLAYSRYLLATLVLLLPAPTSERVAVRYDRAA